MWQHRVCSEPWPRVLRASHSGFIWAACGSREKLRRKEEQEDLLEALDPGYWEEGFDAAAAELAALPTNFDEALLEVELEGRTWCLEVRGRGRGWRANDWHEQHCMICSSFIAAIDGSHRTR